MSCIHKNWTVNAGGLTGHCSDCGIDVPLSELFELLRKRMVGVIEHIDAVAAERLIELGRLRQENLMLRGKLMERGVFV